MGRHGIGHMPAATSQIERMGGRMGCSDGGDALQIRALGMGGAGDIGIGLRAELALHDCFLALGHGLSPCD